MAVMLLIAIHEFRCFKCGFSRQFFFLYKKSCTESVRKSYSEVDAQKAEHGCNDGDDIRNKDNEGNSHADHFREERLPDDSTKSISLKFTKNAAERGLKWFSEKIDN